MLKLWSIHYVYSKQRVFPGCCTSELFSLESERLATFIFTLVTVCIISFFIELAISLLCLHCWSDFSDGLAMVITLDEFIQNIKSVKQIEQKLFIKF